MSKHCLNAQQIKERQEMIFALQRAAQDPEKVREAHKRFLAWKEKKDAGKLPPYEVVGK